MTNRSQISALKGLFCAAALLLAACAQTPGAPLVNNVDVGPSYSPALLRYTAAQGGIPVSFPNLPFLEPRETAVPLLLQSMRTARIGDQIPLLAEAPAGVSPGLRIVVLLDAAASTEAGDLCRGGELTAGSAGERMRVYMAACRGRQPVSRSRGSLLPPARPDDPALGELLRTMLLVTLPPDNPNRGRDGRRKWKP